MQILWNKSYIEKSVKIRQYILDNRDRKKEYYLKNRDKISVRQSELKKSRLKTDVNFHLNINTRRRIHYALNGKTKSSFTIETLGHDKETYRK